MGLRFTTDVNHAQALSNNNFKLSQSILRQINLQLTSSEILNRKSFKAISSLSLYLYLSIFDCTRIPATDLSPFLQIASKITRIATGKYFSLTLAMS